MSIAQYQDLLARISAIQKSLDDLKRAVAPLLIERPEPVRYRKSDETRRARL